jgi:hypothetical protein
VAIKAGVEVDDLSFQQAKVRDPDPPDRGIVAGYE